MSFLFGGGKSKSENKAFPWLKDTFGGTSTSLINQGQTGLSAVQNFLTGADTTGFDQYRKSSGYQNIFDEAMRGVTANAASRGLLGSGAVLRASQDRAGQLAQQQYANYLQQLSGIAQGQMSAGQGLAAIVGNAGGVSTSSQTGGLLGGIGALGQGVGAAVSAFSDIRLKENIVKLGEEPDGLGVYEFNYIGDDTRHVGVMAQEVAELRPHALGPVVDGYMTVDYGKL